MLKAIAKYEVASKFMKGDINSQKLDMANMVIKYIVQNLSKCPHLKWFFFQIHQIAQL